MPKTISVAVPEACTLCPRQCKADRAAGQTASAGRAAPESGRAACTSGGALHQRHPGPAARCFLRLHPQVLLLPELPHQRRRLGKEISVEHLAEIFLSLQAQGAHNINLVTPGQWRPWIIAALDLARAQGLRLPIVCNTGGYETVESVHAWRGFIRHLAGRPEICFPCPFGRTFRCAGLLYAGQARH